MSSLLGMTDLCNEKEIKCGIIGFGSIARKHIEVLQKLRPNAHFFLLTTQDIDPDFHIKKITYLRKIKEFLDCEIDFYVVTSPASDHGLYLEYLKSKNVPIIIEKPLARDVKQAKNIIELFQGEKIVPIVAYNLRFSKALARVETIIQDGGIGEVLSFNAVVGQNLSQWRPGRALMETSSAARSKGGGVLRELSHELDYLYKLFGLPKVLSSTIGQKKFKSFDVEDLAMLHLHYDERQHNVIGSLNLDFIRHDPIRNCDIVGVNGTIRWNLIEGSIKIIGERNTSNCKYIYKNDILETYNEMWVDFLIHEHGKFCTIEEAVSHLAVIEDIESKANFL